MNTLYLGASGPAVLALQQALADQQLDVNVNGQFDWRTRLAVLLWQRRQGLPVTGVAGPAVLTSLGLGDGAANQGPAAPDPVVPASPPLIGSGIPGAGGNSGIVPPMPRRGVGRSLHLGLNRVDPAGYGGWQGPLSGCENDARTMASIARLEGYAPTLLLTAAATRQALVDGIRAISRVSVEGDRFMLTYSGHGGRVPNDNQGADPELDSMDDTWCCYDGMFLDDQVFAALSTFAAGVEVILISDSCHSGTIYRAIPAFPQQPAAVSALSYRVIPEDVLQRLLIERGAEYAAAREALGAERPVAARALALTACQDNQLAQEVGGAGVFTTRLKENWANGTYRGSYFAFHRDLVARMPADQTPQLSLFGTGSLELASRTPFKAAAARGAMKAQPVRRAA